MGTSIDGSTSTRVAETNHSHEPEGTGKAGKATTAPTDTVQKADDGQVRESQTQYTPNSDKEKEKAGLIDTAPLQFAVEDAKADVAKISERLAQYSALLSDWPFGKFSCPTMEDFRKKLDDSGVSDQVKNAIRWLLSHPDELARITGQEGNCLPENVGKLNKNLLSGAVSEDRKALDVANQSVRRAERELSSAETKNAKIKSAEDAATGGEATETDPKKKVVDHHELPPFTSTNSGAARTADAAAFMQGQLDEIDKKISDATTAGDQAAALKLQNERAKIAFCFQALMELQKQQFEMLSNLSKMYSEMSRTALNNLR